VLTFLKNTNNNVDFPKFLLRLELTIGAKMNKKQLVAKISSTLGQSKADAERTFDSITTIILDALKNDDTVKIAGFGTYKVAKRKARVGRNPRTGESIQIAASQKVKFLPAKSLKEMFNR
tara:strand:+ start:166 stop:525 length:360 start_codon:yes stop_codon:yes gene_type:complete